MPRTPAQVRRELEVQLLDACVVATRTSNELDAACETETAETSDQVQAIRMRVHAANEAQRNASHEYVVFLDRSR